ncbi:HAD family phosphatase [Isoptericola halotolerans]|uniref:2-haloacid dehalogenase n=1 Tax=Isoptericola halotolerans TaxID=300560 RepID=A0ABX2A5A1_9MICO|nr:HAD family phosphatase [Isoptericola halotolerans]NOV98003.1 2-haloacid dehalogenase [Isoptericola halotolerans]
MTNHPAPGPSSRERAQRDIDAVIYDFGNVLVGWDPYGAFDGLDRAGVDAWMTDVDFGAFNLAQDAGRTWAEAVAHLEAHQPRLAPMAARYAREYAGTLTGPVAGSAELVAELAAAGVRLYGLTNWAADTFHHAAPAAPAIDLLRDVVVSGRVGLAKPDPAIFRLALDRFGVEAARTVFVDDTLHNVEAARAVGLHAVHFTDTAALRVALAGLGLPVTTRP